jgi:hypothetical protein
MNSYEQAQLTDTVVMVTADQFGYDTETADTNAFQVRPDVSDVTSQTIPEAAVVEFQRMVETLQSHDVRVVTLPSRSDADTPSAVFPNNWFSHHADNTLVLYPMLTPSRRAERQPDALLAVLRQVGIASPEAVDLTAFETDELALEGTGSLVLDRAHHVAFAMESPRTNRRVFDVWCARMGFEPFFFHAYDAARMPIYHTNVVMSVGVDFAVVCPESIHDAAERGALLAKLEELGKEIVSISLEQLYAYCGNILQLRSRHGEPKIVLSRTAASAFSQERRRALERHGELVIVDIPTIERYGGGSARCMLAEIFAPALQSGG